MQFCDKCIILLTQILSFTIQSFITDEKAASLCGRNLTLMFVRQRVQSLANRQS